VRLLGAEGELVAVAEAEEEGAERLLRPRIVL